MDEELERRIVKHHDEGEYQAVVTAIEGGYGSEILGFVRSIVGSWADADDAYGAFSLALVKGVRSFRRQSSFRTWAYVIARREAYRTCRERRDQAGTSVGSDLEGPRSSRPAWRKTDAYLELEELRAMLSPVERELLVLHIDRELSFSEVAMVLSSSAEEQLSEDACRQRFQRLRKKLIDFHTQRMETPVIR